MNAIARLKTINIEETDNLFGGAFRLLIAGVGFTGNHNVGGNAQIYSVFSHAGDYIGRIPGYMVGAIIAHMRRQYFVEYDRCGSDKTGEHSITYGWKGFIPNEEVELLMEKFADKPLEIN